MALLDELKKLGNKLNEELEPVNPAQFGDELAMQTQWTPLKPGGASFRTHKLIAVEPNGMEMQKTLGMIAFALLFLFLGMTVIFVGAVNGHWIQLLFGLPFAGVGGWFLMPRKILFDGGTRQFTAEGKSVSFSQIHAIQLLKERVRGNKTTFFSYELNLVLKDGARAHVVDHGDLAALRSDADRLRVMLGCQLWDAA